MRATVARQQAPADLVLGNARLVLDGEVVTGSLAVRDGLIGDMDLGTALPAGAEDCGGALVMPGLVELHTDNLERHLKPRPGVRWPEAAAVLAHDGELASVGITTVFDALRIGSARLPGTTVTKEGYAHRVGDHIRRLGRQGALRIDHLIHLRAEVCSENVLEGLDAFRDEALVRIVSIMDHTPGQRQHSDEQRYRAYYQEKYGWSAEETQRFADYARELHRSRGAAHEAGIVERARAMGAAIASHDDGSADHVARSLKIGMAFAEFPTTGEAASAYTQARVPVMMGAPNALRGGSHAGNVSAMELALSGHLDILSSDYVPSSLLMAMLKIGRETGDMAAAVRRVTAAPASAVGLEDRGRIAIGRRADLLTLAEVDGLPVIRDLRVRGRKVA